MKSLSFIKVFIPIFIILSLIQAMPPRPGLVLPPEDYEEMARLGINVSKNPVRDKDMRNYFNTPGDVIPLVSGTKQFPVACIQYTDYASTYTVANFQSMLFSDAWTSGSAKQYYSDVSYGTFTLQGTVVGWYTSANNKAYYGYSNGFQRAAILAKEAATATDATINYALYDNDGDGYVDCFTCVHAGFGREETQSGTDIHSHSWDFTSAGIGAYTTNDPDPINGGYIKINEYVMDPERSNYSNNGTMVCIGVFCHEWGHALGLPDLYDTDYSGAGLGYWCLMAGGSWGGNGSSPWYPVHLSVWAKMDLGWLNPTAVRMRDFYSIPQVETNSKAYWLISRQRTFREYFLIENRRKTGFDANMMGQGLLIYHIDDSVIRRARASNAVNNGSIYGVALEQADGNDHLLNGTNSGDANDPWPGGLNKLLFDSTSTTPNSRTNTGSLITSSFVKNIPASASVMSCTLSSGVKGAFTSGADASGYSWIDSDTIGGPTYNWLDISQTGTTLGTGNDASYWFRLPYYFNFYGTNYDTVYVNTNGWISFGNPGTVTYVNAAVPSSSVPNKAVFVFWDDMDVNAADGANMYYQTFGATPNRYTVITWKDVRRNSALYTFNQMTFQVILHESGKIVMQYKDCAVGDSSYNWGKSATIGIENSTGTVGRQYLFNGSPSGNLVSNERAIQFSRKDVGVVSIDYPTGTVDSAGLIIPRATIRNYSAGSENVSVILKISGGYTHIRSKILGAGQEDTVVFNAWQPVRGLFIVRCSTYLLNDMVSTNDTLSAPFTVRVRDIGVISINNPLGAFDSTGPVTPLATLRNYGSEIETFNVTFRIGSVYTQNRSKTLLPNTQDTAGFPVWIPVRGNHLVKCSTYLTNDVRYANDTISGLIAVQVKDVGVMQIVSPNGLIDSSAPLTPQVRLKNYGTGPANLNVQLNIDNGYTENTGQVLASGEERIINFNQWQPTRGTYAVRCSVYLIGDAVQTNDTLSNSVTVRVKDVGVVSIDNPSGSFDSIGSVIPIATLKNYGTASETFNVKFRIGSVYAQTRAKTLNPGQQDTVGFPGWIPVRGTYQIQCSTMLASDVMYSNDTTTNSVTVLVKNIGITQIVSPTGTIDSSPPIIPQVKVKNYGTNQAVFNVWLKIGSGYYVNRAKTINAGIEDTINFVSWQPIRGSHLVKCSVSLSNDAVFTNDTITSSVNVRVKDIAVLAIENPSGIIDSGALIIPRARVKSYGSNQETFSVTLKIGNDYTQTRSKTLNSEQEDTVNFPVWTGVRGNYTTRCSTYLAGEIDNTNDTLSGSFTLIVHDVGVVSITEPADTVDRGLISPRASVKNYGTQHETFYTYCNIYNNLGVKVYTDSSLSNNLNVNATSSRTFDGFPFLTGSYTIRCSTALANDANPGNNVKSKITVVQYQPPWTQRESVPRGPSGKQVKNGSTMVAGGGDIYMLKGNNTREFYRYDVGDDTWVLLDSIPFDTLKAKKVNKGAVLAYNNHANPDLIYAAKGNNTLEFWSYNTETDTWLQKTSVPLDIGSTKKVKAGASAVYMKRGTPQYIYLLKGNNTNEFYAYHCQADSWIRNLSKPPSTPYGKLYKDGSCMTVGKNNNIYLLKGGSKTNEFYYYDPVQNLWFILESLPIYSPLTKKKSKVKTGASLVYDGDSMLYALKGGNRQEFWCYNINQNTWQELDTVPRSPSGKKIGSGASMVFTNDRVYALKGNKTFELWSYTPGISDLPITMIPAKQTMQSTQEIIKNSIVGTELSIAPNPINENTLIKFVLEHKGNVNISLYNSAGQLINVYLNTELDAGVYSIPVNSHKLAKDVYFLKFDNSGQTMTRKIIVK